MSDVFISAGWAFEWWLVLAAMATAARAGIGSRWPIGDALALAVGRWGLLVALTLPLFLLAHLLSVFDAPLIRIATTLAVASLVAVSVAAARQARDHASARPSVRAWIGRRLRAEATFAIPYAVYLLLRGFNHDIYGLEKFMDYGFVNAVLASPAMPPPDPWLAGATINYYYFGHVITAFMIELTGVPPAVGFNLMLATLFGASFALAAALAGEIARSLAPRGASVAAAIAGMWITIGGNLHGFVYGLLRPVAVRLGLVGAPAKPYWLSDSTRFVGHDPPTADKLIHEMPAYAFYVGDLHAHLLDLANVLTLLTVLLAWMRVARAGRDREAWIAAALLGAGTGVVAMTNAWDAAIYGSMIALTIVATGRFAARARGSCAQGGSRALAVTVLAGGIGLAITMLPFMLHFVPFATGISLVHSRTPAWQWMLLYGAPLVLALAGVALTRRMRERGSGAAWRMTAALTLAGLTCALFPEIAYVKDIYGADWYRANTAFKFGFQAFVMLVLAASVAMAALFDAAAVATKAQRRWLAVLAVEVAIVPCLYYGWFVVSGALADAGVRRWTLDGSAYLARETPEDYGVIEWLRKNARPGDTLVEAVGESYTYTARISSNTGVPALLGWPMHEWLWRGASPARDRLANEIAALYRDPHSAGARALLERTHPRYIVVGRLERERHGPVDVDGVESLGTVVWRLGRTSIVRLPLPGGSQ